MADPSVLHLTQLKIGGDQRTSITFGALGGCKQTSNFFMIEKSVIAEEETLLARFPARAVLDIIYVMELLQLISKPNCTEYVDYS